MRHHLAAVSIDAYMADDIVAIGRALCREHVPDYDAHPPHRQWFMALIAAGIKRQREAGDDMDLSSDDDDDDDMERPAQMPRPVANGGGDDDDDDDDDDNGGDQVIFALPGTDPQWEPAVSDPFGLVLREASVPDWYAAVLGGAYSLETFRIFRGGLNPLWVLRRDWTLDLIKLVESGATPPMEGLASDVFVFPLVEWCAYYNIPAAFLGIERYEQLRRDMRKASGGDRPESGHQFQIRFVKNVLLNHLGEHKSGGVYTRNRMEWRRDSLLLLSEYMRMIENAIEIRSWVKDECQPGDERNRKDGYMYHLTSLADRMRITQTDEHPREYHRGTPPLDIIAPGHPSLSITRCATPHQSLYFPAEVVTFLMGYEWDLSETKFDAPCRYSQSVRDSSPLNWLLQPYFCRALSPLLVMSGIMQHAVTGISWDARIVPPLIESYRMLLSAKHLRRVSIRSSIREMDGCLTFAALPGVEFLSLEGKPLESLFDFRALVAPGQAGQTPIQPIQPAPSFGQLLISSSVMANPAAMNREGYEPDLLRIRPRRIPPRLGQAEAIAELLRDENSLLERVVRAYAMSGQGAVVPLDPSEATVSDIASWIASRCSLDLEAVFDAASERIRSGGEAPSMTRWLRANPDFFQFAERASRMRHGDDWLTPLEWTELFLAWYRHCVNVTLVGGTYNYAQLVAGLRARISSKELDVPRSRSLDLELPLSRLRRYGCLPPEILPNILQWVQRWQTFYSERPREDARGLSLVATGCYTVPPFMDTLAAEGGRAHILDLSLLAEDGHPVHVPRALRFHPTVVKMLVQHWAIPVSPVPVIIERTGWTLDRTQHFLWLAGLDPDPGAPRFDLIHLILSVDRLPRPMAPIPVGSIMHLAELNVDLVAEPLP